MTNAEIQKLIDDGVAILKQTTVGYANHSTAWQNNTSTKWWQGLDKLKQARDALNAAPSTPLKVTISGNNIVGSVIKATIST